jgi:hypothetical protein
MNIADVLSSYTAPAKLTIELGKNTFSFEHPDNINKVRVAQRKGEQVASGVKKSYASSLVQECVMLAEFSLDGLTWKDFAAMAEQAGKWYIHIVTAFYTSIPSGPSTEVILHDIEAQAEEEAGND